MNMHTRPPERQVISAEEVARILGYRCRKSFDSKRQDLEARGFPRKLPGLNGWSKPVIMRWLSGNGELQKPEHERKTNRLERRFG